MDHSNASHRRSADARAEQEFRPAEPTGRGREQQSRLGKRLKAPVTDKGAKGGMKTSAPVPSKTYNENKIKYVYTGLPVATKKKAGTTSRKEEGLMKEPHCNDSKARRFVRPFAPNIAPDVIDEILAKGKEFPWKARGVPRGTITGEEFYYTHYHEWLDQGIEITGPLIRRADRALYNQLYKELGPSAFPKRAKHKQRNVPHVRLG